MGFKIVNQPSDLPVSMDEARTAARANGSEMDTEIRAQVAALTAQAEHIIGQVIINRTGRLTLAAFPDKIEIPLSPVASVNEITYADADGNEQTLSSGAYFLNDEGKIERTSGTDWPATFPRAGAVKVDVVCGYGSDDVSTPPAFKGYILAKTRDYFAPPGTPETPGLIRMLDGLKEYD